MFALSSSEPRKTVTRECGFCPNILLAAPENTACQTSWRPAVINAGCALAGLLSGRRKVQVYPREPVDEGIIHEIPLIRVSSWYITI